MALHPQAERVLAELPNVWHDPAAIESMTPEESRALAGETGEREEVAAVPAEVSIEDIEIPGAVTPLRVRVHRPLSTSPPGTILWLRGGGFIHGSLQTDNIPGPLALASGCTVVGLEYRRAPEHPFPAGVEDSYAAFCWVGEHARQLSDGSSVAIGGESAGGNFAAAVTQMAHERAGPTPSLQLLLYPMLARRFDGPSRADPDIGAFAHPEAIEWIWRHYLVTDSDGSDHRASPLYYESLGGLAPAVVVTAEYDVLRDEGEEYARRLAQAGVPVELHRWEGMPHGFVGFQGQIDAADDCIRLMGRYFSAALSPD